VKHSTMPLPRYSAYIFDLDGTMYLGDALLPGAAETIARLRTSGSKVLFLSNNPTRTRAPIRGKIDCARHSDHAGCG
jgi:arabinose operon protein AraL